MVLSKSATYAIRAVLCLSEARDGELLRVDDIAEKLDVPRNYLSKILHTLARKGVLESSRGPKGGFRLAAPTTELSLASIAQHFDELPHENGCLLGRDQCSDHDPCDAHERWAVVRAALMDFLVDTSVADLASSRETTR